MKKQEIHLLGMAICLVTHDVYMILKKMKLVSGSLRGINIELDKSETYPQFFSRHGDRVAVLGLAGISPKVEILCRFHTLVNFIIDAEIQVNIEEGIVGGIGPFEYVRGEDGSVSFSSYSTVELVQEFIAVHKS